MKDKTITINQVKQNHLKKPNGYYSDIRSEMVKYVPENAKKILDVGCGEGSFGFNLKQKLSAEVWGIEMNEPAAVVAQTKLDRVYIGDVTKLVIELPDGYFDCIIFNDILEHLVDPYKVLLNTKTKINNGGLIVCSIPNVRYFFILKDLMINKQWRYRENGVLDKTHLRFFTIQSIADMFNSLDCELIRIEGINPIKLWKFELLNILSLGYLSDTRYLQFACIAKPN